MTQTERVRIGNREYLLKGDDPVMIRNAAKSINDELDSLQLKHKNESPERLMTLAALNLAEKNYKYSKQRDIDQDYLVKEFQKMIDFIEKDF